MKTNIKIFLLVLGLSIGTSASASGPWAIRIGYGTPANCAISNFLDSYDGGYYWSYYKANSLSDYYGGYNGITYASGGLSIGVDYSILKWFAVSADLGVNFLWRDQYASYDAVTPTKEVGTAISFLPKAKFTYLNKPVVKLYSSVGLGFTKYIGYGTLKTSYHTDYGSFIMKDRSFQVLPTLTPIGIELGRNNFFGFAELVMDTINSGIKVGVGYKF